MITRAQLSERLSRVDNLAALAREAGVGDKTVRRLAAGTHSPTLDTLLRVLHALERRGECADDPRRRDPAQLQGSATPSTSTEGVA